MNLASFGALRGATLLSIDLKVKGSVAEHNHLTALDLLSTIRSAAGAALLTPSHISELSLGRNSWLGGY